MIILVIASLIALAVLILVLNSYIVVGGTQLAMLERKWVGKPLPAGRVIAQDGEIGQQARLLGPGFHLLTPFIFKTEKTNFMVIGKNEVGLVESIDGDPVSPGHIFGKMVDCNFFQDAEAFLKNGGQKGPQVQVLPPGAYKINPRLFTVTVVDAISVGEGIIGVIIARDGKPIPTGRLLGGHVEGHNNFQDGQAFITGGGQKGPQLDILLPGTYYINTRLFEVKTAKAAIIESGSVGMVDALDGDPLPPNEFVAHSVEGHRDFQDGAAFLANRGQRGPQLDVLKPGIYYVNPLMFGIIGAAVTEVERGQVAVIVSNIGKEPDAAIKEQLSKQLGADIGADASKEVYVLPAGYRGIQQEVQGPGRYYLNLRAFIPYIVDTTNITIDWDVDDSVDFDPLSIVSQDGFVISVSVKVIVRVRPDQAPYMVAKVGSIESLIKNVIHPMIDSSFRNQASTTEAMAFMQNRKEEQGKAEEHVRQELSKYHVECVSVLICQINLPQDLMDTQTKKVLAEQQLPQYEAQQKSEEGRISVEKTRATASAQQNVVNAEVAVLVAEQKKKETVTLAEADSQSATLRGQGEASAISAKGLATAQALQKQQEALGATNLTIVKAMEQLKDYPFPLSPQILTMGSNAEGGLSGILTKFLAANIATDPKKAT